MKRRPGGLVARVLWILRLNERDIGRPLHNRGELNLNPRGIDDQFGDVYREAHAPEVKLARRVAECFELLEEVLPQVGDVLHPVASFSVFFATR